MLRRMASLLRSEGHGLNVFEYPIGFLIEEAEIAEARINAKIATEAISINMAINAAFSKPANQAFAKYLSRLRGEEHGD